MTPEREDLINWNNQFLSVCYVEFSCCKICLLWHQWCHWCWGTSTSYFSLDWASEDTHKNTCSLACKLATFSTAKMAFKNMSEDTFSISIRTVHPGTCRHCWHGSTAGDLRSFLGQFSTNRNVLLQLSTFTIVADWTSTRDLAKNQRKLDN